MEVVKNREPIPTVNGTDVVVEFKVVVVLVALPRPILATIGASLRTTLFARVATEMVIAERIINRGDKVASNKYQVQEECMEHGARPKSRCPGHDLGFDDGLE